MDPARHRRADADALARTCRCGSRRFKSRLRGFLKPRRCKCATQPGGSRCLVPRIPPMARAARRTKAMMSLHAAWLHPSMMLEGLGTGREAGRISPRSRRPMPPRTEKEQGDVRFMLRLTGVFAFAVFAATGMPCTAHGQAYPARSITVVVPFPAGGASDVVARIVAEHMGRTLGTQIVIEN